MLKQIVELLMVIIIGLVPMGNNTNETQPAPAVTTAAVTSEQDDGIKCARWQNMLNHNYCFGDAFEDKAQLIESAAITLYSKIENGYISKAAVDAYILNMYGIDCADCTQSDREGYYSVPPIGFDVYDHDIISFEYNGDGTVTVHSKMAVGGDADRVYDCVSVFFADGGSAFGYRLISCDVNW